MELQDVQKQLTSLEARLTTIEASLGFRPGVNEAAPPRTTPPLQPMLTPVNPSKPVPEDSAPLHYGNWLGIIAVICFVVAAGFIIKLSIESGWLTPARQIGLAALFGFGLIGAGVALLKTDKAYASFLPGAGVVILYLSFFAAHRYYALINFDTAIAASCGVSALCIWLYLRIRSDIYPLTAALGAYVAPVILNFDADAVFSLYYFVACSMAFATISIWVKSRILGMTAAYLAVLMTGLVGVDLNDNALVMGLLTLHFLVFSASTYLCSTHNRKTLSESEAWCYLPVLLLFYVFQYYMIDRIHHAFAPWFSLVFAGFLLALYMAAKKRFSENLHSEAVVLAFATIVAFHSIYVVLLPDDARPWLFVFFMLGAAFLPVDFSKAKDSRFVLPALAVVIIVFAEFIDILAHLANGHEAPWLLVAIAAFASMWTTLTLGEDKFPRASAQGNALLGAAHVLAVLGLYRLTTDIGSLAVSASWLFYAVAVLFVAYTRKDDVMAKSALFVLAFAAAKALLYDAASAATIVRILCLLLTGAALYGCGLFMRRIDKWSAEEPTISRRS